ncbi:DUF262 domain-containing protein [Hydrogenophaga sp. IBVHS1]|uniref:DUF262 domain-containing protein n=1 Tax=unclassified Hydrogenophaga TaxID=2610897 RepID=UPI000A2D8BAB|nr:DUF262 domain-containing protein [Hydrogenophaga sp. IBVHS1]OSZ74616.1 hypothetical protein CAP37_03905 [Hydrogenophaga sp. IBVHS1]
MIITPAALSINQIFGSNNEQYVIPTYQRRYSWKDRQIWELIDDIKLIENADTHLLGSIVCLASHHTAGLNKLELVDGQQRLTTVSILLECIRQRLLEKGEADEAAEVARLLTAKPMGGKPVRKVSLDSIDSDEFDRLVLNDETKEFKNLQLKSAFETIRKWIASQSLKDLGIFLYRLQNQAIVIRLDVGEAKDAFKLFETINNRGLRLSPTDIIKNFLLGNAARFSDESLQAARKSWAALILNLDGTNSDAFFRYYLMSLEQTRLTAANVVPVFKKVFMERVAEASALPERHLYTEVEESEDTDGEELVDARQGTVEILDSTKSAKTTKVEFTTFLSELVLRAKHYGELVLVKTTDEKTNRHLRNLKMIKAVQTYGFLMHLRAGGCQDKVFLEVLRLTESFVLRRHICRERSNETEALFARLCSVNPRNPGEATRKAYRELCPSDEKFRTEFSETKFTGTVIDRARFCLEQIELSKQGQFDELNVLGAAEVHVEHIIPQKIKSKKDRDEFGDWITYLGEGAEAKHPQYVSRIGNLTIFSGPLNIAASNNPFAAKKAAYRKSALKITQDLVGKPHFRFIEVTQRSGELADLAVAIWPLP